MTCKAPSELRKKKCSCFWRRSSTSHDEWTEFQVKNLCSSPLNCYHRWTKIVRIKTHIWQRVVWSQGRRCPEHTHTDGVDVRLVACEGLPAHAVPDVPQLDRGVAGPRHKGAEVGRQGQTHDVTAVARENRGLLTRLDVPQCTEAESAELETELLGENVFFLLHSDCILISVSHHVVSPELVMIWLSSMKRQHDR